MEVDIKFSKNFRSFSKNVGHKKIRSGTPKNGEDPSIFFRKSKVLDDAPLKQNLNNGQIPATPEVGCKIYGKIICLTNQPR